MNKYNFFEQEIFNECTSTLSDIHEKYEPIDKLLDIIKKFDKIKEKENIDKIKYDCILLNIIDFKNCFPYEFNNSIILKGNKKEVLIVGVIYINKKYI